MSEVAWQGFPLPTWLNSSDRPFGSMDSLGSSEAGVEELIWKGSAPPDVPGEGPFPSDFSVQV